MTETVKSEAARIAEQLTRAYEGGAWHGPAVREVLAGVTADAAAARPVYVAGDIYPALPAGCAYTPYAGLTYYNCGSIWFTPNYGANGVYYRAVPSPY